MPIIGTQIPSANLTPGVGLDRGAMHRRHRP
jgi:hypothetical protein